MSEPQHESKYEPTIKVLRVDPAARLPHYAHTGPWGDLAADLYALHVATLPAGATALIPTGIALEFPSDFGALIEDRSGLALGFPAGFGALSQSRSGLAIKGISTLGGVIDPGYRGEIKIVITNVSPIAHTLAAGDRIAQLRIVRRITANFLEVDSLAEAPRGAGGFGSTGL